MATEKTMLKKDLEQALKVANEEKSQMANQVQELSGLVEKLMAEIKESKSQPVVMKDIYSGSRRVVIMNFLNASYNLTDHDGREVVRFKGFGDTATLTVDNLGIITSKNKKLFNNLGIKILDKEVAEEFGYQHLYDKHYTEEDMVDKLMAMEDDNEFISELNKYPKKLQESVISMIAFGIAKNKPNYSNFNRTNILATTYGVDFNKLVANAQIAVNHMANK